MNLLNRILQCEESEIDTIIDTALCVMNQSAIGGKTLGFGQNLSFVPVHKGFISFDSRIKYSGLGVESYSMKTNDYFYEFAHFLRRNNISRKEYFVGFLEIFINQYFGKCKYSYDARGRVFSDVAWNTTKMDDEYFQKLENNELGDLKGSGVAMCTERAAVAQNLLALFGFETYYCMGCVNTGAKDEAHCFNIARAKDNYMLLDYSLPVSVFEKGQEIFSLPFQGAIDVSEIDDVLMNGIIREINSYHIVKDGSRYKIRYGDMTRKYVVGRFTLGQDKPKGKKQI